MAHLNLYKPDANWYVRYIRVSDGGVWNGTDIATDTAYASSAIDLTYSDVLGGYPVTIPSGLPDGEYDMLFYDAASPAAGDDVEVGKRFRKAGGAIYGPKEKFVAY